jgi:ATP-dependent Zn protease
LYVAKEFVRYGEEQSTHFYATTNRLRDRWEKRKGRFSDYSRYRIGRIVRYAFWTVALGYLIDGATDKCTGTIGCATAIPALVVQNFQTILFMALNIAMGFAGLFLMMWVLARMDLYQVIHPASIRTRFSDVYGQDKAVARMRENLFLLENPEVVEKRGGYMPGGLLLVGPPGTGKSLLAEALAGETGKPFVSVGPESFTNMFVGVPIMKVKMLYRHLRKLSVKHGGVVVFFDEIDALGSRGGGVLEQAARVVLSAIGRLVGLPDEMVITGGGAGSGALQMVLSEMSGLAKPRGLYNKIRVLIGFEPVPPPHYRILHVGATNRADDLDPALLRPGRYDRHIKVGRPNADGIAETLRGYLAKLDDHNVTDQEIQTLAKENPGATGASIKDIVNEALLTTIREERTTVTAKDIREALIWKRMGEDRGRQTVEDDHRRVCLHEASHAVVAHHFRQRSQIQYASIVMRDRNLGVVSSAPIEERHTRPRSEIEADIRVALASVWAERHFFEGDLSTGPSSDLEKATEQAAGMVSRFAMDEYLSVSKLQFDQLPDEQKDAVNRLLQRLYDETDLFLSDRVDQIEAVAALLDVQSTVDGVEIHDLLAGMEAA